MQAIKDILEGIWNFLQGVWEFVQNLVEGMIKAVQLVGNAVRSLTDALEYIPTPIKVYSTITITILVVLFITNRTGGKADE